MADQIPDFIDGDLNLSNRVKAAWLNDVNDATYRANTGISGATPNRTALSKFADTISVKDFGALGDGVTDDTAAINAAAVAAGTRGEVFFPKPASSYLCGSALTQLANQKWTGAGGFAGNIIKKGFNGDLLTMGDQGVLSNLEIDGNGATYTGKNIIVSGFNSTIENVYSKQSVGAGISVTAGAGGGLVLNNVVADTTVPLTVAAIDLTGATASNPKFLSNIWLSGGMLDISGANDVFVDGMYCHHVVTSSTTANYYFNNIRWASAGATISIQGSGGQFSSSAYAGAVALSNSSGLQFAASNEFVFGITEDPATCTFNSFFGQSTAYTPVWDQASGTQPVLGNGTITGRYIRCGRICKMQILLILGSTTTTGNGSVAYRFSVPFTTHNAFTQNLVLNAKVWDASTGTNYPMDVQAASNVAVLTLTDVNAAVRDGFPIVWAVSDRIYIACEFTTL